MIIANGFVCYLVADGEGGIDEKTGYPIPVTATLSDPFPCQYSASTLNYLSKDNGEPVTKQIYSVLLDQRDGKPLSDRVKLFKTDMTEVGEFPVISCTDLDAVCQYKLTL